MFNYCFCLNRLCHERICVASTPNSDALFSTSSFVIPLRWSCWRIAFWVSFGLNCFLRALSCGSGISCVANKKELCASSPRFADDCEWFVGFEMLNVPKMSLWL